LGWLWRLLLQWLLPPRCLGCRQRGTLLCEPCWQALPWLGGGVCGRCAGRRLPGQPCRACERLAGALVLVRAACSYDGPARAAVHVLKFRAGRQAAPILGALVRESLRRRPLRAELVVPVPLAPRRLRWRGYNQAALLAEQVAATLGGQLAKDVLEREDRPAQRTLSAAARLDNLRGAIRCRTPALVAGRRVVLVDDVMTTGATLSSCAEALAGAGARQVLGLVFARTL
jgi:ComF family protein